MWTMMLLLSCAARQSPGETAGEPVYLELAPNLPRLCVSQVPDAGRLRDRGAGWRAAVDALLAGDTAAAGEALAAAGEHPGLEAARAAQALLEGRIEEGRVGFRDLANEWREDACLQQAAAFAHLRADALQYGTAFASAAARLAPDDVDAQLINGLACRMTGDVSGASAAWRAALSAEPGHPLASAMLADDFLAKGEAALALPLLEDALEGGLPVQGLLVPAYYEARRLGDYLRLTSAQGYPLGDGGALAAAADPEAAFKELLGVGADGVLLATIETSMGDLRCELFWERAPVAVANFVGLARGTQPWTDPVTGAPGEGSYYSGTIFHRVIPDFMIQAGDRTATGAGTPGYRFPDEFDPGLRFDEPATLGMANNGADRNGAQFFITEVPTPHLNDKHTVFGRCDEASLSVVRAIARVERGRMDKPLEDVVLERIVVPAE